MLILTRRISEAVIMSDGDITIRVLSVNGKQVRLGIDAPEEVSVHREEIHEKIASQEAGEAQSNNA